MTKLSFQKLGDCWKTGPRRRNAAQRSRARAGAASARVQSVRRVRRTQPSVYFTAYREARALAGLEWRVL